MLLKKQRDSSFPARVRLKQSLPPKWSTCPRVIWEFQPGLEVFTNPGSCQDKGSRTGIFPREGLSELVFADKAGDTNCRGATLTGLWWKSQGERRHFGNVTMHKCPLRSPVPPQASAESALLGGTWVVPVGTVFMEDSVAEQLFFYVQIGVILEIGLSLKSLKSTLCPLDGKRKKNQSRTESSKFLPIQAFEVGGNQ